MAISKFRLLFIYTDTLNAIHVREWRIKRNVATNKTLQEIFYDMLTNYDVIDFDILGGVEQELLHTLIIDGDVAFISSSEEILAFELKKA